MRKTICLLLAAALLLPALFSAAEGFQPGSVQYSERLQAVITAAHALEETYGITPEMLVYFTREVTPGDNGTWRITWKGDDVFVTALGVYTASVSAGKAAVTWSHDGKANDGSYNSAVWGSEQLRTLLSKVATQHDYSAEWLRAQSIMAAAGDLPNSGAWGGAEEPADGEDTELQPQIDDSVQAKDLSKVSLNEAAVIARTAIQRVYGLTDAQASMLEWQEEDVWYRMESGNPQVLLRFWLWQGSEDYTPMDGGYNVTVNVDTGIVDDMHFESNLAGNG